MTLPVALPRAAKRRASPRRALRVSGCGGCTRRDLITGLVTSATSAGGSRLDASAELSSKARTAYDASFARTMETGMADYELHMAMVKRELFRDLAGKDVLEIGMNTGPNLRYMRDARSVIGVEPNSQSFPYARANAERFGVQNLVLKKGNRRTSPGDSRREPRLRRLDARDVHREGPSGGGARGVKSVEARGAVPARRPRTGGGWNTTSRDAASVRSAEPINVRRVLVAPRPGGRVARRGVRQS